MAYHYVEFGGVALPLYNQRQDHDAAGMRSAIVRGIGGAVDYYGTRDGTAQGQQIAVNGLFAGETGYLVDQDCNRLVDENGDYLIAETAAMAVESEVADLRRKVRQRDTLTRERLHDSYREWNTARLLQVQWPRRWTDSVLLAELTCQFEVLDDGWRSETSTVAGRTLTDGIQKSLFVQNGGNLTVTDAVITVTHISGTITQVDIDGTDAGIDLRWTGSLASGSLVIDCGAGTVQKAGADSYVASFMQSGHTARTWLPLDPGETELLVTVTGGGATVSVEFYQKNP